MMFRCPHAQLFIFNEIIEETQNETAAIQRYFH